MGYHLTNLYSISPDDKHSYFVFYIGGRFDDMFSQWIDRNFSKIATALGGDAVIVRGLTEEFDNQVFEAYQDQIKTVVIEEVWDKKFHLEHSVVEIIKSYHATHSLDFRELFPLMFVTDRNPSVEVRDNDEKIFYLIPLGKIGKESEIREIFETIIYSIQHQNFSSLDKLLAKKFGNTPLNLLDAINQSLELKPNVAGLGINLNAVIDWVVRKQKE